MTSFTSLQKMMIAQAIKREVENLVGAWEKPMKIREKAIMGAVADAILSLPSNDDEMRT